MMNRGKSTTRKSSTSNATSKNKINNKNQLPNDTVYLLQNENDILKIKNKQLSYRVDALNMQVKQRKQRISDKEKQCQNIREAITGTIYVKDIQLENQKRIFLDKLLLSDQKIRSMETKIDDLRREVVIEQDRIPTLISQHKRMQQQLRILKMENQGLKKVLINLEEQNQEMRQKNHQLSLKKVSKQPEQRAISQQIQQRIRLMKNLNVTQKTFRKQKSAQLILQIVANLFLQRKKICFLTTQRHGLKKALIKKKLFLLTLIRKNYLNFVKNKVMSVFREPLRPLPQEEKCMRILQDMKNRRQKAKMWRIWRNQTAKAEYSLIRKYESQTVIQKIANTMMKGLVFCAFNKMRNFRNDHRVEISLLKMYNVLAKNIKNPIKGFFSILQRDNNSYQIQQQIQNSAEQQSKALILGRIFYGWVAWMKDKKKESLTLKFKYFKKLKKIFVIKKRNVLSQMLGETKIRLNEVKIKSICFAALKKQLFTIKDERTIQEKQKLSVTLKDLTQDTENRLILDEQIDKTQAMFKVQRHLNRKVKEAFSIWRVQNKRIHAVSKFLSLISLYTQKSVNYAFSRIQIRRFEKLKLSIKDKIASCDYSYNYLVQQNTHIKEVLDKKSHELEKAKFTAILQRLIRRQKEIKHKYFYKFLKNGFKCWKVKKSLQNIDYLMKKKLSLVLFFLLKLNKTEKIQQQKIQTFTSRKDEKIACQLLRNSIKCFKQCVERNKRMRRALAGVFDRNMELNFYQAFGKMRNESYQFQLNQIQQHQIQLEQQIKKTDQNILVTQQTIQTLSERLKTKEQIFKERKTMSIYKFFAKNIKNSVGKYIKRWKNKVDEEKRIMSFINNLQRKTQHIVKMRLLFAIQKTKQELYQRQLENKLVKYTDEYEHANEYFDKFIATSQEKIAAMEIENQKNDQIVSEYEKKIEHINKVKVESFLRHWGKNVSKFVFREWKNQKNELKEKLTAVFNVLSTFTVRDPFKKLSQQVREQLVRDRIRKNLNRAMTKTYRHNVGMYFKIWRNVNINTKIKQGESALKQAMKGMEHIEQKLVDVKEKYNNEVNYRIHQWKLRRITNQWRIYTQKKLNNNKNYLQLTKWLSVGYSADIISVLTRNRNKCIKEKNIIESFKQKVIQDRARAFLKYIYNVKLSKNTIQRLFINKFCYHKIYQLKQQFLSKVKNYQRFKEVQQTDRRTCCIQKVIYTFQKKRKGILCQNMRLWKRNMYLMQIEKNLLRRLVKNAMNNRVKDLFYAWKLQTQARNMVRQHTQEGQVKKRKVEIKRLKKFIDDYKKEKGLLLENQQGDYVVSPRFQQNKQKQVKRQNLLKYKFVSRLILSMNGYEAPVKAWNNLETFSKLRVKCQKFSLIVKNRMQKGDLYTCFKKWQNDVRQVRKNFEEMQRTDLIRLLNRQKDRMQIQYGKKVDVQEKVQRQLRRYKLLSYQDKRKQRIFAQILFRQARKVKEFAFETWRKRAEESRDQELHDLQERGNNKLYSMQQQVHDLEQYYQDLENNNRMLKQAVQEALQLADMIKRISQERDQLHRQLAESNISCENLQQQNEELNNKLILAQRQAMNLLSLSNKGI